MDFKLHAIFFKIVNILTARVIYVSTVRILYFTKYKVKR